MFLSRYAKHKLNWLIIIQNKLKLENIFSRENFRKALLKFPFRSGHTAIILVASCYESTLDSKDEWLRIGFQFTVILSTTAIPYHKCHKAGRGRGKQRKKKHYNNCGLGNCRSVYYNTNRHHHTTGYQKVTDEIEGAHRLTRIGKPSCSSYLPE